MPPRIEETNENYDKLEMMTAHHPARDQHHNEKSSSRLTIKGVVFFFFRIFLFLLFLLLVTGMISSALSLYNYYDPYDDYHQHHPTTTTHTTVTTAASFVIRNGIISWVWSLINWMPPIIILSDHKRLEWQQTCWDAASSAYYDESLSSSSYYYDDNNYELEIPRIAIRDLYKESNDDDENFPELVSNYLIQTYGTDWRERPLLLEGILDYINYNSTNTDTSKEEGQDSRNVRQRKNLSLQGLLQLDQVIPYFQQANQPGALTPTAKAPVSEIVQGMLSGKPYKIGSQLLVQEHPEWMQELTGSTTTDDTSTTTTTTGNLLSYLFGNHFSPQHVLPGRFLPATTTVPVFVANLAKNHVILEPPQQECSLETRRDESSSSCQEDQRQQQQDDDSSSSNNNNKKNQKPRHITTGLHCEPIGNVAFQIEGSKEWTLVSPRYSTMLQPSLANDGRAFFSSSLKVGSNQKLTDVLTQRKVPHWTVVTGPSDALWVPTWTWHRVDYRLSHNNSDAPAPTTTTENVQKCAHVDGTSAAADPTTNEECHYYYYEVAIGGSIFHFRPWDFLRRNPLYAVLIIPALIKELAGISTQ